MVKSITLRNINTENVTLEEQLQKLYEERHEFEIAVLEALYNRNYGNDKHAIEEALDEIQSVLSYLNKTLGITAQEVMDHYYLHEQKILNRPRKKINFKFILKTADGLQEINNPYLLKILSEKNTYKLDELVDVKINKFSNIVRKLRIIKLNDNEITVAKEE